MFNLFSKKKKFSAKCELTNTPLQRESTYIISGAQIISSRKFWDNVMTEPDTMSYTEAYFKKRDETAKNIRSMIFKRYANEDKIWIISDSQIHLFDIDESHSKELADKWWDSEGDEIPVDFVNSLAEMDNELFESHKNYAIEQAGKHLVRA